MRSTMATDIEAFQACQDIIYSNDYADYIIQAVGGSEELKRAYNYECIKRIGIRQYM